MTSQNDTVQSNGKIVSMFRSYNLKMDRNIKTISGIMESESKDLLNKFFNKIRN